MMRKRFRKGISILLMLAMIGNAIPMSVYAEIAGSLQQGTENALDDSYEEKEEIIENEETEAEES